MTALTLKPDIAARLAWSPDRLPVVCSVCAGALPEVPLLLFRQVGADSHSAAFCDRCTRTSFVVQK